MKFLKLLLIFAIVASSALGVAAQTVAVPAQQKAIKKKDFEKIEKRAKKLLETTSYRVTKTTGKLLKQNEEPRVWHKLVEDYVPPDRIRTLSETLLDDGKWSKYESIVIGQIKFERKNADPWKSKKGSGKHDPIGPRYSWDDEQYFSEGAVVIDGKTADAFRVERKSRIDAGIITPLELTCRDKTIYWYDGDGRLLKLLFEHACKDTKGSEYMKNGRTEIYEYDPNIKIEAPIK